MQKDVKEMGPKDGTLRHTTVALTDLGFSALDLHKEAPVCEKTFQNIDYVTGDIQSHNFGEETVPPHAVEGFFDVERTSHCATLVSKVQYHVVM